jgi:hypothetical protein
MKYQLGEYLLASLLILYFILSVFNSTAQNAACVYHFESGEYSATLQNGGVGSDVHITITEDFLKMNQGDICDVLLFGSELLTKVKPSGVYHDDDMIIDLTLPERFLIQPKDPIINDPIKVYPNPVRDVINVENYDGLTLIIDRSGRVVKEFYGSAVLDMNAGIYFLKTEKETRQIVKM